MPDEPITGSGPEPSLAARLARDRARPDVAAPDPGGEPLTASSAGPDEDPALELAEGEASTPPTGRVDAAHATLGRRRNPEGEPGPAGC
jgi:hypothetical protein